jgi:hypothetical protein
MTGPTTTTRNGVLKRDGYRCQRCGRVIGFGANLQHRRARAAGGRGAGSPINMPENLIALDGSGTTGCHGWITEHPEEARTFGWEVSSNATVYGPEDVPFLGRDEHGAEQWYWLEGFDRIPVPEGTALMRMVSLGIREDGL